MQIARMRSVAAALDGVGRTIGWLGAINGWYPSDVKRQLAIT